MHSVVVNLSLPWQYHRTVSHSLKIMSQVHSLVPFIFLLFLLYLWEMHISTASFESNFIKSEKLTPQTTNLHCWRESKMIERAEKAMLITGCGYSATGIMARAFTAAGYDIGHEIVGRDGTSTWFAAGGLPQSQN